MFTEYNTGLTRASNQAEQEYLDEQRDKVTAEADKARLQNAQDKVWKLRINFEFPPIPVRGFDWSCTSKDYDLGDMVGRGATIQAAIEDWLEWICFEVDHVDFNKEDVCYIWQ